MYTAREQADILKELQDASEIEASKIEGTFENDVLASNSLEFQKIEVELEQAYKAAFAETSWGEYLTMRAAEFGVDRKAAVKAVGSVTVSGTKGASIPQGSLFATDDNLMFATDDAAVIPDTGHVDIAVTAQTAGIAGNVLANTITRIPMSIPGVSSVTNTGAMHDGYDEEDDTSLYNRLVFKVRQPATSGNVNDYIEWATSVSGVGKVKVIPIWNGNGTVKVIVTNANGETASDTLLQAVRDYIESRHPVGADVTVVAPEIVNIAIALTVTNGTGNADAIKDLINKYFVSNDFDGEKVSYAVLGRMILDNSDTIGVLDYDNLTLNGGTSNITVTSEQLPNISEVTFNG